MSKIPSVRDGFCIACAPGEPGELLGGVGGAMEYDGYTDRAASERKLVRDAFARGDAWFRTGDLLRQDADGYYYFVDRIGDTFRWKGENVATQEVADVLGGAAGVTEANVYGVEVPGDPVQATETLAKQTGMREHEQKGMLRHLIEGGDLSAFGYISAAHPTRST